MRNASEGAEARKPHGGSAGGAGADRSIKLELDIQKERMGKLIGTNGQTIKNIQEKVSTVRLNTPGKDDAASDEYKFVAVTLKGKASDVFKASKMVHDVATACLAVLTFRIEPHFVELLQRPGIQGLKQSIAVDNMFFPRKQDKEPKVMLEGFLEDVIKAYQFIIDEVVKADRDNQKARENQKLMQISQRRMGGGAGAEAGAADSEAPGAAAGGGGGGGGGRSSRRSGRPSGGNSARGGGGDAKKPAAAAAGTE